MNVAIVTARADSQRLPGKHMRLVGGRRLIEWPLRAALDAQQVDEVYLATDSATISEAAIDLGARCLQLPPGLCGNQGTQAASLCWAVGTLDVQLQSPRRLENVVALLGNTVMVSAADVDAALSMLRLHPEADSVMSVWRAEDDHPNRALARGADGFLVNYQGLNERSSNVQGYSEAYYQDQGVWAFRKENAYLSDGPSPWWWMGRKCLPLEREWWVGRDVDVEADVAMAELWLQANQKREVNRA